MTLLILASMLMIFSTGCAGSGCSREREPVRREQSNGSKKDAAPLSKDNSITLNTIEDLHIAVDRGNINIKKAWDILNPRLKENSEDVSLLVLKAKLLWTSGKLRESEKTIDIVLKKDPRNDAAFALKAKLLLDRFGGKKGMKLIDELIAGSPDKYENRLLKGRALFQMGKYDEAEQIYRSLIDKYPDRVEAYQGLSVLYYSSRRPEEGLKFVKSALDREWKNPSDRARLLVNTGEIYQNEDDINEALKYYNEAVMTDPGNKDAVSKFETYSPLKTMKTSPLKMVDNSVPLKNAGDIKKALDSDNINIDKAERLLNSLISKAPGDLSLFVLKARLLRLEDNNDESFRTLEGILSKDPDNPDALALKTEILLDSFKDEEAEKTADKLVNLKPDVRKYRLLKARALARLRDFDEAEKILLKLIKEQPDEVSYYIWLSDVYESSLQEDMDMDFINKALARGWPDKPAGSKLITRMGELLEKQGRLHESTNYYKKALALDPENADARAKLALGINDPVRNWAEVEKAMEPETDSPYPLFALARLYRNDRQFALARAILYKGIKKYPQEDAGYRILGDFAFELKDYREARDAYDRLKILRPGDYNTLVGEALLATAGRDFKKADSILSRINPPEHLKGDFYRRLGDACLFHLRDYDKAALYYNRAIKDIDKSEDLSERSVAALVNLGNIELLKGHDDRADKYFRRATEKAPKNFYVYTGIIRTCIQRKKYGLAKKYMNEWEKVNTLWAARDRILAYLSFAEPYMINGDMDESINMAEQARKVDPEAPPYGKLLLVFKNEKNNARSYYGRNVEAEPDDYMSWFYLGLLSEEDGETDKSERCYKEAMKGLRYPGDLDYQKAWIYSVRRDKAKALQYLRKSCNENVYNAAKAYSDEVFDWMRNDPFFKQELPGLIKQIKDRA
ncbi:MAG: tetratricopeptide repeat protein [Chloroflexi bacterium]|nr:tetratricopeptide repeat protein [Chloroflexota bacterium]